MLFLKSKEEKLRRAVLNRDLDLINKHIDDGANIDHYYKSGNTPLVIASAYAYDDVVELLIKRGANLELRVEDNETALLYTSHYMHTGTISEILINNGANLNAKNDSGDTSLIMSCRHGYKKTALLLIEKGADVNLYNKYGETALICAARNKDLEIVELLISKIGNEELVKQIDRAIDEAAKKRNKDIFELLSKHKHAICKSPEMSELEKEEKELVALLDKELEEEYKKTGVIPVKSSEYIDLYEYSDELEKLIQKCKAELKKTDNKVAVTEIFNRVNKRLNDVNSAIVKSHRVQNDKYGIKDNKNIKPATRL
jgi:ankyrin repeat protein